MLGILRADHPHWIGRNRILASASSRSRLSARGHRRDQPQSGAGRASGVWCRSRQPTWERATACRCGRRISEDRDGGASDISTTMIYTHVLKVGSAGVRSPIDALLQGGMG